jgi:hypothetical protein
MNGNNLNSNRMDISDKASHRTHHTRFFEKLYGNLEKSSEKRVECSLIDESLTTDLGRRETLTSPSNSSGSSLENFSSETSGSRCEK